MKLGILITITAIILSSCASLFKTPYSNIPLFSNLGPGSRPILNSKYIEYGSAVEVIENNASAKIKYRSFEVMCNELDEKAKTEMWTEDKLQMALSSVPKSGCIMFYVYGATINAANTENWMYIIQTMNGKDLIRKEGENNIPEHTTLSQYATIWWNIDSACLSKEIEGPYKVYVIDQLNNLRSGFIIYPNQ